MIKIERSGVTTTSLDGEIPRSAALGEVEVFVQTSELFQFVENREEIISELLRLQSSSETSEKIAQLTWSLTKVNMRFEAESIFQDPDIEYLALIAVMEERITKSQMATILTRQKALEGREGDFIEIPFPRVASCLKIFNKEVLKGPLKKFMSKKCIEEFAARALRELPASETRVFINSHKSEGTLRFLRLEKFLKAKKLSIIEYAKKILEEKHREKVTIGDALGTHGFCLYGPRISDFHFIFPVGLMEFLLKFLHEKYEIPGEGIAPTYRFGAGPAESIREGYLCDERIVSLPFKGIPLPKFADNYYSPFELFTLHDWYHLVFSLFIPSECRRKFIEWGDHFHQVSKSIKDPYFAEFFSILAWKYHDMECLAFQPKHRAKEMNIAVPDPIKAFWESVVTLHYFSKFSYVGGALLQGKSEEEIREALIEMPFIAKDLSKFAPFYQDLFSRLEERYIQGLVAFEYEDSPVTKEEKKRAHLIPFFQSLVNFA